MSDVTPQQARTALAEAAARSAMVVREADRRLRLLPLVIAATYLAIGTVFALPLAHKGYIVPLILVAGLAGAIGLGARIQAYSRIGKRRFQMAFVAFSLWNGAVAGGSMALGWWAPGSPSWHFTASAVVAVLPLLAGAVLVGRSRR